MSLPVDATSTARPPARRAEADPERIAVGLSVLVRLVLFQVVRGSRTRGYHPTVFRR